MGRLRLRIKPKIRWMDGSCLVLLPSCERSGAERSLRWGSADEGEGDELELRGSAHHVVQCSADLAWRGFESAVGARERWRELVFREHVMLDRCRRREKWAIQVGGLPTNFAFPTKS